MRGRVLIVAGSDSGGGAGIQADIKAVTCLGGFAMTAITALTAQNTLGVHGVLPIQTGFITQQIAVVLEDLGADCIKTGMLHDTATIASVVDALAAGAPGVPLVCDPVMIAKGGHPLLQAEAVDALRARLLPRASLLTPNLPEAEALLGRAIVDDPEAMAAAATALRAAGPAAVFLKGGHG
ncbi:MAG: hydroxymethylpyrimidine/phosphomethylpyrimidine kinase, partial [Alphaproteobacteria bacterium]